MAMPGVSSSAMNFADSMRRSVNIPPWMMGKSARWYDSVALSLLCSATHSLAQRWVRSMAARAYSLLQPNGAHSSKAIMMSAPRACSISITLLGLKKCVLPSIIDLNSTPSSRIFTRFCIFGLSLGTCLRWLKSAPKEKT